MSKHSTLTGDDLHEPKGIEEATSGEVYVSDGSGSGSWESLEASNITVEDTEGRFSYTNVEEVLQELYLSMPGGWGHYKDSGSSAQVIGTTATKLAINALGSTTYTSKLPPAIRSTGNLWDSVTNTITPIVEGDAYSVRVDLPVTAKTGSPDEVTLQLDIGGDAGITIPIVEKVITTTTTAPYNLSFSFPIFCGSTFLANGGQLFIKTNAGTISVEAPSISIFRITNGNV